jgi:hypothetical protein
MGVVRHRLFGELNLRLTGKVTAFDEILTCFGPVLARRAQPLESAINGP